MPERFAYCIVKRRYINTLPFLFLFYKATESYIIVTRICLLILLLLLVDRSECKTCCFVLDSDIPHVMISYHWGSQKTMIYVRDKLKAAGYKVWMDIDNMSKYCSYS